MSKLLEEKLCIVTGAGRGIGKALALKYAENGANIVLVDLIEENIQSVAEEVREYGVKALPIVLDVTSESQILDAIEEIESHFKQIDVLANCAGISTSGLLIDVSEREWQRVFDVNLKSIFLFSKHVAKRMIEKKVENGKIVSISSQASKIGELGNGPYCASKAGVNSITQVLALELAQHGIAVNAVSPGYVNTEMLQEVFQKRSKVEGKLPQEYENLLTVEVPMNRLAEPEEIADSMVFLSSENANYITGISLTVAGGKTII